MTNRKCCNTPRGSGPHAGGCPQGMTSLNRAMNDGGVSKETRREILEEVAGDMGDGAYLAMAEELGLTLEDLE